MFFKSKKITYETGSLSGTTIPDPAPAPSKEFTYIKAKRKKGERVYYLDRKYNLVDASRADTFSLDEAHEISMEMRNLRKNYEFTIFSTSEPLNDRAQKIAEEKPKPVTSKEKAESQKKPKPSPSNKSLQDPVKHDDDSVPPPPPIFIGMIVSHKKYGEGTIVKFDHENNHLTVAFAEGEKIFLFPDCFENGFLVAKA